MDRADTYILGAGWVRGSVDPWIITVIEHV